MGYGSSRNYGRRGYSRPQTAGRVAKANSRPGPCRYCKTEIPAGAGQLWREADGSWSVVHVEESQGGWLMHPQPVHGGCPDSTDKRNAELHASGFLGPDAPAPMSEHERIANAAARWAASNPAPAPRRSYARTVPRYERCTHEDYPCCGCDRG